MTHGQKIELIKHLYPTTRTQEIAKLLNMHYSNVRYYGVKFGLKKNDDVIEEQKHDRVKKALEVRGLTFRREKELAEKQNDYWEKVKEFKQYQLETHGRFHPFYKLQFKSQANG
jgi:transposase